MKRKLSPELDFTSENFNPEKALKYDIPLPYPKAKVYDNIAHWYNHTFKKASERKDESIKYDVLVLKRNFKWFYNTLRLRLPYNFDESREYVKPFKRKRKYNLYGTFKPPTVKVEDPKLLEPMRSSKIIQKQSDGSTFKYIYVSREGTVINVSLARNASNVSYKAKDKVNEEDVFLSYKKAKEFHWFKTYSATLSVIENVFQIINDASKVDNSSDLKSVSQPAPEHFRSSENMKDFLLESVASYLKDNNITGHSNETSVCQLRLVDSEEKSASEKISRNNNDMDYKLLNFHSAVCDILSAKYKTNTLVNKGVNVIENKFSNPSLPLSVSALDSERYAISEIKGNQSTSQRGNSIKGIDKKYAEISVSKNAVNYVHDRNHKRKIPLCESDRNVNNDEIFKTSKISCNSKTSVENSVRSNAVEDCKIMKMSKLSANSHAIGNISFKPDNSFIKSYKIPKIKRKNADENLRDISERKPTFLKSDGIVPDSFHKPSSSSRNFVKNMQEKSFYSNESCYNTKRSKDEKIFTTDKNISSKMPALESRKKGKTNENIKSSISTNNFNHKSGSFNKDNHGLNIDSSFEINKVCLDEKLISKETRISNELSNKNDVKESKIFDIDSNNVSHFKKRNSLCIMNDKALKFKGNKSDKLSSDKRLSESKGKKAESNKKRKIIEKSNCAKRKDPKQSEPSDVGHILSKSVDKTSEKRKNLKETKKCSLSPCDSIDNFSHDRNNETRFLLTENEHLNSKGINSIDKESKSKTNTNYNMPMIMQSSQDEKNKENPEASDVMMLESDSKAIPCDKIKHENSKNKSNSEQTERKLSHNKSFSEGIPLLKVGSKNKKRHTKTQNSFSDSDLKTITSSNNHSASKETESDDDKLLFKNKCPSKEMSSKKNVKDKQASNNSTNVNSANEGVKKKLDAFPSTDQTSDSSCKTNNTIKDLRSPVELKPKAKKICNEISSSNTEKNLEAFASSLSSCKVFDDLSESPLICKKNYGNKICVTEKVNKSFSKEELAVNDQTIVDKMGKSPEIPTDSATVVQNSIFLNQEKNDELFIVKRRRKIKGDDTYTKSTSVDENQVITKEDEKDVLRKGSKSVKIKNHVPPEKLSNTECSSPVEISNLKNKYADGHEKILDNSSSSEENVLLDEVKQSEQLTSLNSKCDFKHLYDEQDNQTMKPNNEQDNQQNKESPKTLSIELNRKVKIRFGEKYENRKHPEKLEDNVTFNLSYVHTTDNLDIDNAEVILMKSKEDGGNKPIPKTKNSVSKKSLRKTDVLVDSAEIKKNLKEAIGDSSSVTKFVKNIVCDDNRISSKNSSTTLDKSPKCSISKETSLLDIARKSRNIKHTDNPDIDNAEAILMINKEDEENKPVPTAKNLEASLEKANVLIDSDENRKNLKEALDPSSSVLKSVENKKCDSDKTNFVEDNNRIPSKNTSITLDKSPKFGISKEMSLLDLARRARNKVHQII